MFKYLNDEYISRRSGEHYPKRIIRASNGCFIVGPAPQPLVRLVDEEGVIVEINLYDVVKKHFGKVTRENAQIVFDNIKKAGEIPMIGLDIEDIEQYCVS